jgi:hypothetical protein
MTDRHIGLHFKILLHSSGENEGAGARKSLECIRAVEMNCIWMSHA